MDQDLAGYKKLYLQTAKEYIDSLFSSCSELSVNPADNEAINKVHISSHSLKSQSQVMGFTNIANLAESIEKISNDILNKTRTVDDEFKFFLKSSIDKLNLELAAVGKGDAEMGSA